MRKLLLAFLICVIPFLMGPTPRAGYRGPSMAFIGEETYTNSVGDPGSGYGYADIYTTSGASFRELMVRIEHLQVIGHTGNVVGLYAQLLTTAGNPLPDAAYNNTVRGFCGAVYNLHVGGTLDTGFRLMHDTVGPPSILNQANATTFGELLISQESSRPYLLSHLAWTGDAGTEAGEACNQVTGGVYETASVNVGGVRLLLTNNAAQYPLTGVSVDGDVSPAAVTAASHGLITGQVVYFSGCSDPQYNGHSFTMTSTGAGTFTLDEVTGGDDADATGCTVYISFDSALRLYGRTE